MNPPSLRYLLLATLVATITVPAQADVAVTALFSDHAVLQKGPKIPIWGTASPGERVTVSLGTVKAEAVTKPDGKWRVNLDLHATAQGPFELVIQGKNKRVISDVLVGEVWVCSGQSNMQFGLTGAIGANEEIAASANPSLRFLTIPQRNTPVPVDNSDPKLAQMWPPDVKWVVASPETSGGFSAIGYYFGRNLQKHLKVPVGLINNAVGGTTVEQWTSAEMLDSDPDLKVGRAKVIKADADSKSYVTRYPAWVEQYSRKDHPCANEDAWAAPGASTAGWKPITMPSLFAAAGLPDAGAVWIRTKVTVTPEYTKKGVYMDLGSTHDFVTVYWDGKKIADDDRRNLPAINHYGAPAEMATEGEHTLALRIYSPFGGMGASNGTFNVNNVLVKDWVAKAEFTLPPLTAAAKAAYPQKVPPVYSLPCDLFNGNTSPIIPYAMRGVIWYQGESNVDRSYQYRKSFPLMIRDWRTRWGQGDFPFLFCQLANISILGRNPGNPDGWAELRESQTKSLVVPNTGQAILIDLGESGDIHPRNKKDVGDRLERIAYAQTYKGKIVWSGPAYQSMKVEGPAIRLHFAHTDGGLVAKPLPATYQPSSKEPKTEPFTGNRPGSQLEGFAICGEDQKWVWADAKISGTDVIVSSPEVSKPVAVRYAWASFPICNLYNGEGLPAGPFRTDEFPLGSQKALF